MRMEILKFCSEEMYLRNIVECVIAVSGRRHSIKREVFFPDHYHSCVPLRRSYCEFNLNYNVLSIIK